MRLPFVFSVLTAACSRAAVQADYVKLDISNLFNVKAAATSAADANFDGNGRAYPVEYLPSAPTFDYLGLQFDLPPFHDASANDAIKASGQTVSVPTGAYQVFSALAISFPGTDSANVTVNFADGSSTVAPIIVAPWYSSGSMFDGPIWTPWHYANPALDSNLTIDYNRTHIQYVTTSLPSDRNISSLVLPGTDAAMAFFSITLVPAVPSPIAPTLQVQNVRSTTKWLNEGATGNDRVTINNLATRNASIDTWILTNHTVAISSPFLTTVRPGSFRRLRASDQIIVTVGVQNAAGVSAGTPTNATIVVTDASGQTVAVERADQGWTVTAGIPDWQNNDDSLSTHEAPNWFDDANVPAWAPTGAQYAEWYDWWLHNPPNNQSAVWRHHLATYGPDVVYDDFIQNFTASAWSPDDWIDLFVNAGAKYFVLVTKHHDGFALFDTGNSSNRNSLLLGPKRDVVQELMDTAKAKAPQLRRGTYFSLPEWFNPAYGPYGHGSWPGHPALNAFNGSCCDPFIGYVPVADYIQDLQRPQMETLFTDPRYETDILWCDIGFASAFPHIGGDWYNFAASQGRQVVRDDRCGSNQTDFVTPEYATFPVRLSEKWESSEGIDPFSYGYNSDTPPNGYQNANGILPKFIDMVSKGGNYLLDIGPTANGSIVPEMTEPLLTIGSWLNKAGEAIYSTRPWFITPEDMTSGFADVRFTTTTDAFYIIALSAISGGGLRTPAPVPIVANDTVTMLGGTGQPLNWTVSDGVLEIQVSDAELAMTEIAWAFKVAYYA
ncbi:glycoside hydrolase family 29 protein [Vararia minispora EC-137]|uniref:Glycoside hydrolase family 29 protein n=1 Tax=Vararia minispora EC-137 TaxID=1314806 RepID=A0ACB8QWX8_9AGAM|nr:glycoside hydrolase family 29 protein [Vararia minispora EC-137]